MSGREFLDEIQPHLNKIKDCARALPDGSELAVSDLDSMIPGHVAPECYLECVINGFSPGKYDSLFTICCLHFPSHPDVMVEYAAIMEICKKYIPSKNKA